MRTLRLECSSAAPFEYPLGRWETGYPWIFLNTYFELRVLKFLVEEMLNCRFDLFNFAVLMVFFFFFYFQNYDYFKIGNEPTWLRCFLRFFSLFNRWKLPCQSLEILFAQNQSLPFFFYYNIFLRNLVLKILLVHRHKFICIFSCCFISYNLFVHKICAKKKKPKQISIKDTNIGQLVIKSVYYIDLTLKIKNDYLFYESKLQHFWDFFFVFANGNSLLELWSYQH